MDGGWVGNLQLQDFTDRFVFFGFLNRREELFGRWKYLDVCR